MWFDARRALAELPPAGNAESEAPAGANRANRANPPPSGPTRLARLARLAPPGAEKAEAPEAADQPKNCSPFGRARTWTGRVVSLDEWRSLTEWDRFGPNGRMWNAITGKWE